MTIAPAASRPTEQTVTDLLLERNRHYADAYRDPGLDARPGRQLAVVTCMDARLDVHAMLGLDLGDAHVIRNAGGVVTDDVIRSLTISQRLLGTRAVMLIHHTTCGMLSVTEDFRRVLQDEVGMRPSWAVEAFGDLESDVRQSLARVRTSPFLADAADVRGFVQDVRKGELREVH
jgi:carbonic anhydrase